MSHLPDTDTPAGPFEGPEKLLEIWFAPSPANLPDASSAVDGKIGLRKVPRQVWEEMLDIVQCKVLSVVQGTEMDAYLLSESSLFVSPHRLILKTCGTTLNLLGLPRILDIAKEHASLGSVYRCFYSRKAFMFPEKQQGPHRDWNAEVQFLDNIFPEGAAYTIGKVNGDHWLLYMSSPGDDSAGGTAPSSPTIRQRALAADDGEGVPVDTSDDLKVDYTIEILMTDLAPEARAHFDTSSSPLDVPNTDPTAHAIALSSACGISELFSPSITTLDAYSFLPCGYSSNALIRWRDDAGKNLSTSGEGYYTIHVTPEEGWSYASFECNVPLSTCSNHNGIPDLKTLVRRVVDIFRPGRLTLTLFISSEENANAEDEDGQSAVEAAQRAFRAALTLPRPWSDEASQKENQKPGLYKRTDKINYEFGGYDLAFASFERRS
ncbi:spermidine resistance protein [Steccherinum ochraceum]|uniref:adenosylmethionine decarboxylase n=1 Tax=Steccherinum ochraceum TaxID=92696 RepID=A0A4R0R5J5_9APHY|nr:spermidine resistance protein [Steccherinum ochraceum]